MTNNGVHTDWFREVRPMVRVNAQAHERVRKRMVKHRMNENCLLYNAATV